MIPAPYTLGTRRLILGAVDAHGDPVISYAAPIDWPVMAVAPGAMDEPGQGNRDLSLILWTVYAPVSAATPEARDLVTYAGSDYAVNGEARDWTQGPWGAGNAGVVVELVKVEG